MIDDYDEKSPTEIRLDSIMSRIFLVSHAA